MRIAIFGLAKSGTTALFFKIRNSWKRDEPLKTLFEPNALAIPRNRRDSILAKVLIGPESYADYSSFLPVEKKIVLVRDPRDRLISRVLYHIFDAPPEVTEEGFQSFRRLLSAKIEDPDSVPLYDLVLETLYHFSPHLKHKPLEDKRRSMLRFAGQGREWQFFVERKLVRFERIRYEDFIDEKLASLEAYLGFTLDRSAEVDAEYARVKRSSSYGHWVSWFTPEDLEWCQEAFGECIQDHGYAPTNAVTHRDGSPPVIPRETSLDYIDDLWKRRNKRLLGGS